MKLFVLIIAGFAFLQLAYCSTNVIRYGNIANRMTLSVDSDVNEAKHHIVKRQFGTPSNPDFSYTSGNQQIPDLNWNGDSFLPDKNPNQIEDFLMPNNQDTSNNFITITRTTQTTSSTVAIPGMDTTKSACEDGCLATSQYDPVCGDNNITYSNIQRLKCAQRCGINVSLKYPGSCRS